MKGAMNVLSKRRDKKGRILRNGESQRADGRYAFVYTDCFGKQKFLYSWKLEETDPLPAGRRKCKSLREKEKEVRRDIDNGIIPYGGNLTVLELVQKYISQKTGVRHNTQANYNFVIHSVRGVVRPAFQMAVDDYLLRKNPFEFQLCTVVVNDSVTREAITRKQERAMLEFVQKDDHFRRYYEGIFILFKTGLRISEFVGLQKSDIDFEKNTIKVDHQLQRKRNMEYIIEDTKTPDGERYLPMSQEVKECFQKIIANRRKPKCEPVIRDKDGKLYHGFLYLDKNDMPMVALHWEKYFQHIISKYNNIYKEELPKVTPHVCRHTYCSNMAKSGMNPKVLQYLMGHADISVTMNTYTHLGFDDAKDEIERITSMA